MNPDVSIQNSNIKQFPPITRQMALEIANQSCNANLAEFDCRSRKSERCCIYGVNPDEPCWYVYVPWNDELTALRSSRVIVISRVTGAILYDGSVGDEG